MVHSMSEVKCLWGTFLLPNLFSDIITWNSIVHNENEDSAGQQDNAGGNLLHMAMVALMHSNMGGVDWKACKGAWGKENDA